MVRSTPIETWKDWMAFHLIETYGEVLPKALADEEFAFFGKKLLGVPQQLPRWQRAVFVVNGLLGDAVGQVYAQKYFSPEAKARAEAMVANLIPAASQASRSADDEHESVRPKAGGGEAEALDALWWVSGSSGKLGAITRIMR